MNFCSKCGAELRAGLKFCTSCGAVVRSEGDTAGDQPFDDTTSGTAGASSHQSAAGGAKSSGATTEALDTRPLAPTIVIAPIERKSGAKLAKSLAKGFLGFMVAVAVIIIGVFTTAWFLSNPLRQTQIEEVDNQKYNQMLSLVEDVRNPNFDEIIDDLLTKSGRAENYSFLEEYTAKFTEILGDDYSPEEQLFCDCCYFVWYTEYQAKRYDWLSKNSGLLNGLYTGKASKYRKYADTLYDMLTSANSETDLNNIKIYCKDHDIISTKE